MDVKLRLEPHYLQCFVLLLNIREKYERLRQSNAFARGDKMCDVKSTHHFAERLDSDVVAASLSAENRTHRNITFQHGRESEVLSSAQAKDCSLKKGKLQYYPSLACPRSKEARQTQPNAYDDRQTSGRRRRRKAESVQGYAILRA